MPVWLIPSNNITIWSVFEKLLKKKGLNLIFYGLISNNQNKIVKNIILNIIKRFFNKLIVILYPKKHMRCNFFKLLFLLVLTGSFFNCARRGTPTGGPKDSIPPILTKAVPDIETINFDETKIKIYFDEYVKLNDVKKKLVISPPQKYDPIITPLGTASKFISIKILDTLDPNTTYAFNFGNSIVDNNEENELENFKYVFSTGTYIDSLKISGEVTDIILKESASNIDVMLYEYDSTFTDSIIYKEKPRYIANTIDSTLYELSNLRKGKYLLIALKDANFNKIYNPETDKIGFVNDTVTLPTDENFNFTIFKEIPLFDLVNPKEANKGHIIFGYMGNPKGINIELLSETPPDFKSEINFDKYKDTINFWYTPFQTDSLNFLVSKDDYSENFTVRTRSSDIDSLTILKSTSSVLHLIDTFSIESNTPIINVDKSLIKLTDKDTLSVDFNTILSRSKTKLYINFDKQHDQKYAFEMLPNTITDIFGISNDTIAVDLITNTPEDYGTININVVSTKKSSFIVELLNENEIVIRTSKIDNPQIVNFPIVPPGKYLIRVTLDANSNGIWDTGSFLNRRQPEIIKYFDTEIELRANWEFNETINLD